ncbi:MAG TPA: ROK family protein [Candidatus Limnocylindrales bacterium]|nr:ROK family protein [Candidatus Limnocylindrales bacterium]
MSVDPTATADRPLRVGVDIGGSKVAVIVVDGTDRVVGRRLVPAASSDPDEAIAQIASVIRAAVGEAGATLGDVRAIGLGVPGRVDTATGDVHFAVNLGWEHLPLGRRVEEALGVACVVENDVRAAAIGLHLGQTFGPTDDLVYLGIGTGISAGVVLDGRLHRGVRGLAGEIGHVVLEPDGAPCACGLRGCFETISAGAGIARAAREAAAAGPTALATIAEPTAADVFAAAVRGDDAATKIVDRAAAAIARIVHELVLAYDVELVVLGGGISRAGRPLLDRVLAGLDRIGAPSPFAAELLGETTVRLAGPDRDIGTRGAIALLGSVREPRVATGRASAPSAATAGEEVVARERVS